MNPSRILPDLQCSLVCEDVRQEITGNFMLIGVISLIRVPQIPVTAWRLFVFNRWTAGIGQFLEVARLVGPDQSTVLRKGQTQFTLENPAQNMTNVTMFAQIQFPSPGIYYIEVLVDDVMKLRYPLPVVVVQTQGAAQPRPTHPPPPTKPDPTGPRSTPGEKPPEPGIPEA